jgi:uncharacterized protein YkwD
LKSNIWSLVIAAGIIGLIIFAIRWNTFQSDSTPAEITGTPTTPQPTAPATLQVSATALITRTKTPVQKETPAATTTPVLHTVQQGDTPYSVANLYNVAVEELMAANAITDPTRLQIGQELHIPSGTQAGSTAKKDSSVEHKIENGDTLFSLALQYGSSVDEILAVNPGLEPTALQVGQTIVIPLDGSVPPAAPPSANKSPAPLGTPPAGNVELALEMISAVNTERENNGLSPLSPDDQLAAVALAHAQDMVAQNYFDHVTPAGKTLRDRLQEQGLEPYWVGENIQRNTEPPGQTVPTALGWFMGSPPHRDNILHAKFTHIGVGVVEGPPGWYTFVLVFAQP